MLSFASQTPDTQTRVPTAAVQVATAAGVDGSTVPFASLGTHVPVAGAIPLHQSPLGQSVSERQPVTHSPVVELQTFPVWPSQSVLVVHLPH